MVGTALTQSIDQIVLSPTTKMFIPSESWVVDTSNRAKVMIFHIDPEFRNDEMTYPPRGEVVIASRELVIPQSLEEFDEALAGLDELTPEMIYSLALLQPKGEKGVLLTGTRTNIFPKVRIGCALRTVVVVWLEAGWMFFAYLFAGGAGARWDDYRIFSAIPVES